MSVMVGTGKGVHSATKLLTERCGSFEKEMWNPCLQMLFFQLCRYNNKKCDDLLNWQYDQGPFLKFAVRPIQNPNIVTLTYQGWMKKL